MVSWALGCVLKGKTQHGQMRLGKQVVPEAQSLHSVAEGRGPQFNPLLTTLPRLWGPLLHPKAQLLATAARLPVQESHALWPCHCHQVCSSAGQVPAAAR